MTARQLALGIAASPAAWSTLLHRETTGYHFGGARGQPSGAEVGFTA